MLVYQFTRVVFGVASSPFLLNATLKKHLSTYQSTDPEIVNNLLRFLYVDDLILGANDSYDAFQLHSRTKEIMQQGRFNMRKWKSNSPELSKLMNENESAAFVDQSKTIGKPDDDMSYAKQAVCSQPSDDKVLGTIWNNTTDKLLVRFDKVL